MILMICIMIGKIMDGGAESAYLHELNTCLKRLIYIQRVNIRLDETSLECPIFGLCLIVLYHIF